MACAPISKSYIFFTVFHGIAFVFALAVCGIYGSDIQHSARNEEDIDPRMVFAVVLGSMSTMTCLLYLIPGFLYNANLLMTFWDLFLFVLWITVFGLFGKLYINKDAEGDRDIQRMKDAVWVDLVNALTWLFLVIATACYWRKNRNREDKDRNAQPSNV
ncbi:unnamed protein product [Clonostachys rosea]|uniref:MARVEL domain-containing protein n=1 Tax=Bionectria ochroleuca TaxID=29856 RepID=A0ABY6UZ23_BIOOC|nr:unnamed protein product [Clonostachys rosea]